MVLLEYLVYDPLGLIAITFSRSLNDVEGRVDGNAALWNLRKTNDVSAAE